MAYDRMIETHAPMRSTRLLCAIAFLAFTAILALHIFIYADSDWINHVRFAREFLADGRLRVIHFTFHALVIALAIGIVVALPLTALIVGIGAIMATFVLLVRRTRTAVGSVALLVASPITVLSAQNLYFGYIGFNSLHSPTTVLLKPLALALFGLAVTAFTPSFRGTRQWMAWMAVLCLVSTFAKPNFALALVPALVVVAVSRTLRGCVTKQNVIAIGGIGAFLVGILGVQYVAQYTLIDGVRSGITFAPLASVYMYEPSLMAIAGKFVLSIAFPLTVALLYRKQVRDDVALELAWGIFVFGAAQMYLLAETGVRAPDGNFWWGAQIGAFLLFVASFTSLSRLRHSGSRWRYRLAIGVFTVHVTCGAVFLLLRLVSPGQTSFW